MINQESKTLREFSSEFTVKGGTLVVYFGYDTAANHSGFYIDASFNGSIRSSSNERLKRIRSLGIDIFDRIIDAVGTTVYGVPEDFNEKTRSIIDRYLDIGSDVLIEDVDRAYRLHSNDECPHCVALDGMIQQYEDASTEKQKVSILTKFNNSQRIRLIEMTRDLIRDIRDAYFSGIEYNGRVSELCFEGMLLKHENPTYYKRDIDYVRKARVRLFRDVLKRKYKPVGK